MTQPHIICAFPGTGKSWLAERVGWHDSDSSSFSKLSDGSRNPEFPDNYVAHIKLMSGVVLASSHQEVRNALKKEGLKFDLCYPRLWNDTIKSEYLKRFRVRGSTKEFIQLVDENWNEWLISMHNDVESYNDVKSGCRHRVLTDYLEYLSDIVGDLLVKDIEQRRNAFSPLSSEDQHKLSGAVGALEVMGCKYVNGMWYKPVRFTPDDRHYPSKTEMLPLVPWATGISQEKSNG